MAIKVTGFTGKNIRKSIEILVSKQSEKLIIAYRDKFLDHLQTVAKEWQDVICEKLSEPVQGSFKDKTYIRNTSLWPRMQEGRLVAAVLEPTITRSYSTAAHSLRKNQLRFKVSNFYGPRIETIGAELDTMPEDGGGVKPFAGWLNRANREWDRLLQDRGVTSGARYLKKTYGV